jgi:glutathione S-transferase
MITLYSNRFSGHSYKIAMLLALADVDYHRIDVDLSKPREERGADFRNDSRFLEVPVLIDGDEKICQSNQILTHLAGKLTRFAGRSNADKLRVGEWLFWESNRIGFSASNLRLYRRFISSFPEGLEQFLSARATDDLGVLDSALSQSLFLIGDELTIADLSCCAYLFWADEAGLDIEQWPNVSAWLARIAEQPGWGRPEVLLTS